MSRQDNRSGQRFESYLSEYHSSLRARKLADVRKVPTPVRITRQNGQYVSGKLGGKSTVDYQGTLDRGRAISIEAKKRAHKTRFEFSAIAEHQAKFLTIQMELGAIALVVVQSTRTGGGLYVIPWEQIRHWQVLGQKSAKWETLDRANRVKPGQGWFEWLQTASLEAVAPGGQGRLL